MTITGVVVDNPGSGYTAAPNVVILTARRSTRSLGGDRRDGDGHALKVDSVVLDTFGAGYTVAPDGGDHGSHRRRRRRDRLGVDRRRCGRPP